MDPRTEGAQRTRRTPPDEGPFVLRTLLDDVPLSAEGDDPDIKINCVDYLGESRLTLSLDARALSARPGAHY